MKEAMKDKVGKLQQPTPAQQDMPLPSMIDTSKQRKSRFEVPRYFPSPPTSFRAASSEERRPSSPQLRQIENILELSGEIQSLLNAYEGIIPLLSSLDESISQFNGSKISAGSENQTQKQIPIEDISHLVQISHQIRSLLIDTLSSDDSINHLRDPRITPALVPLPGYFRPLISCVRGPARGETVESGSSDTTEQRRLSDDAVFFMKTVNDMHVQQNKSMEHEDRLDRSDATAGNNGTTNSNTKSTKPRKTAGRASIPNGHIVANGIDTPNQKPSKVSPNSSRSISPKQAKPTSKPESKVSKVTKPKKPKQVSSSTSSKACTQCGNSSTPEWRKGPQGPKTTCNACGLFYSKLLKKFDTQRADSILNQRTKEMNQYGEIDRRVP